MSILRRLANRDCSRRGILETKVDNKELLGVLSSIAIQLLESEQVVLNDQKLKIKRVGSGRLRTVQFKINGRQFEAIEQNRNKPSRWGQLAREKHKVVQFRDRETHKYVAVAVDGEITEYGR